MGGPALRALARRRRRARAAPAAGARRSTPSTASAWLGITPFRLTNLRLRGMPPLPWVSAFPELNVRTYATRDGRPGIWFFSLDAASALARRGRQAPLPPAVPPRADDRRAASATTSTTSRRARAPRSARRYRAERRRLHRRAGHARALPHGALLPLHGRRRPALPRRHPPPAVAAAARDGDDRPQHDGAGRQLPERGAAPTVRARQDVVVWSLEEVARVAFRRCDAAAPRRSRLRLRRGGARRAQARRSASPPTASASCRRRSIRRTDLVAALLTFFAVGVAARPADVAHQYGHGKAEHLAGARRGDVPRRREPLHLGRRRSSACSRRRRAEVEATWWAIARDRDRDRRSTRAARAVSWRVARRYSSAALASNALHFASDLVGSAAVLVGLAARPRAATRRRLDRRAVRRRARARRRGRPDQAERRRAHGPGARRRRGRGDGGDRARSTRRSTCGGCACGRPRAAQFADVVIGVSPGAAVGQGHAAADAVEAAVERALPGSDVVVHVEPRDDEAGAPRPRARGRARRARRARDPQPRAPRRRRPDRALAAPEAAGRPAARRRARTSPRRSSARSVAAVPEIDDGADRTSSRSTEDAAARARRTSTPRSSRTSSAR